MLEGGESLARDCYGGRVEQRIQHVLITSI